MPTAPRPRFTRLVGALVALLAVVALPTLGPSPATAAPAAAAAPAPATVLISEVANGGSGADTNAARVSADNFMEIANFGAEPVDISGWRLLRCGQTGDAYGPQKVFPDGTVLAPGDTFTVAGPTANATDIPRDAVYDETGSNLHEFGFGAWLETRDHEVVDRVGFYHPSVFSDCGQDDRALSRPLDYRLDESHQRVARTGDPETDWIVATRTPDAPNATRPADKLAPGPVKITEVANGSAASDADQYVELTNTGTEPVDITGWKLFRCGENGSAYHQVPSLPIGVIAPGASYVVSHASAAPSIPRQATYPTGMHWRDFGAMIVRPDEKIVDRVGFYENRNSICTAGDPKTENSDQLQAESYHRVSDTGDNEADFMLARERSPGTVSPSSALSPRAPFERGPLRISEIVGAGPAGGAEELIEIGNYGDQPIDLKGYSLTRCEGTGKGNAGTQVADLGDVSLAPGEAYLAVDDSAPAALRAVADAEYVTGLNEVDGYGAYLRVPDGRLVDAVGVYETTDYSPCVVIGSELRNYTKNDLGESYQRARTTGDNEEDFMKTPGRSPGELADVAWVDPTEPLPGELDPVEVAEPTVPGTPDVRGRGDGTAYTARVTTGDEDGDRLDVSVRTATPVDVAGTRVWAGATARKVPASLTIVGERRVATAPSLTTRAGDSAYPFQRYAVPVAEVPEGGLEFHWSGTTRARNEVQLLAWDGTEWQPLASGVPSADGDLTLVGTASADHVVAGELNVLVIDGPRTTGGAVDEIGVEDQRFLDPEQYDVALNHATDTQFLSEGFRDVYRRMVTWVVANADARKIGYATNTGDIIENWIGGNADPVRARKEFAAARKIQQLLNDADVPNGVLPGNHDNLWGRDNRLYNEYFGPEMYRDEAWWGDSWRPGDNSAHYDFVDAGGLELLVLNLPYRPTQQQIDWAAEVAAAYPDHNVALLTHSYLTTEKEIENRDNRYTARGEDIWTDLVAPSDNIFLVLGGHYHGVATKYGDPVTGEQVDAIPIAHDTVAVRNTGATGRTVVQMLADYQGYRSTQPTPRSDTLDRDTGFQRLLQLDLDAELMAVNSYSPHLDSFEAWRYDEPGYRGDNARYDATDDEFVAKVDLLVDKEVATAAWGVTGASTEAGTAAVAAGATAEVAVADATDGDLLRAVVTDAGGRMVTSTPLVVSVAGVPGAATTTTLESTRTRQVVGAGAEDRALLTASVTTESDAEVAGEVAFVDGSRVLGTVPVVDGEAELRLPALLAAGRHAVVARFLPADEEALAGSESSPVPVVVTRARATTTAALADGSIGPRQRGRVTVLVRATSVEPTGRVSVRVTGGGRTRTVTARLADGRGVVRLPRLPRGTYRVVASYAGSALVTGDSAPARTLRVR